MFQRSSPRPVRHTSTDDPPNAKEAGGDSGSELQQLAERERRGPRVSLLGRAMKLLAQREHSRPELKRKLAAHAESDEQLDALLDSLEQRNYLSQARFVESVVQRRSGRFGALRIAQELDQHGIDGARKAEALAALRESERARALLVWRKRFGAVPQDASERARQQRFLAQRGFSGDTIGWVFKIGVHEPEL